MSEVFRWEGGAVEVRARLVARHLWMTASIDVFLDGNCILRTGGSASFTGVRSSSFRHSGSLHMAELSWCVAGFLPVFPYRLAIDGVPVANSRVSVKNWPLAIIPALLIGTGILVISHLIHLRGA